MTFEPHTWFSLGVIAGVLITLMVVTLGNRKDKK